MWKVATIFHKFTHCKSFLYTFAAEKISPMSKIVRIVIHCTSDPANACRSREYYHHLFFEVYGWHHYGYHFVVHQDGSVDTLQPTPTPTAYGGIIDNATIANGAKGFNQDSLHVAYVGGIDPLTRKAADTRTPQQKASLAALVYQLCRRYKVREVVGHRDLPGVKKACPGFNVRKEFPNV